MLTRRICSASRGQAILETALMMPLFLLGLFGVIWAMRMSSITERTQAAVRYGGTVSVTKDVYLSYSLYSLYAAIDGQPAIVPSTCISGNLAQITAARTSFWAPIAGSPATSCVGTISVMTGGSQNTLFENDFIRTSADAPAGNYLTSNVFHGDSSQTTVASSNFYRSPDVGSLAQCTGIGATIKLSFEGYNDVGTVASPTATGLPVAVPVNTVVPATAVCANLGTPLPSPSPTSPPTAHPRPSYTTGATPAPTAVPTIAPKGTPTPAPTPPPGTPAPGSVS